VAWLPGIELSAVNPGGKGATPQMLQYNHRVVVSIIKVQVEQPQHLLPVRIERLGLATGRSKDHEQSHATCKIKDGDNRTLSAQ
jgi:hypothetical protein